MGDAVPLFDGRSGNPRDYVVVDDIDSALVRVRRLGGVTEGKTAVKGMGWSALCSDSEGNTFRLWQVDSAAE
jgi:predicted enzyme related to lactoylglutathione lyase